MEVGLWEVIRALIKETPQRSLTLVLPYEDTMRNLPSATREKALSTPSVLAPRSQIPSLHNCEKHVSVV